MKSMFRLIIPVSATVLALAGQSHAALVLGGDFQLYKPGSTTITAELVDNGFAQWTSALTTPVSPDSMNVATGSANYSDATSGSEADLLGWTKPQGGADIVNNGVGGSAALNLFAAWGGFPRPIVDTAGSLHMIGAADTITITTMVGGPSGGPKSGSFFFSLYANGVEVTPSSSINQSLPLDEGFQMISRTYDSTALAAHVGQTTSIRIAVPDSNTIGNRIIFDDVSFTVVPEPSSIALLGLGGLFFLFRRR